MAISLRQAGTMTAATAAVTAVNPSVPANTVSGDLSVLTVVAKPYNTVITTPSGWTKIGEATNGTVANGVDTGSTIVAVYVRESAPTGAIGNIGQTGANSMGAVIHSYQKAAADTWDYSSWTSGGDTTNGANYSATGGANLNLLPGDWVLASTAVNSDLGTVSAGQIAATGATFGTVAARIGNGTTGLITTGNDTRLMTYDRPVTGGVSTAAPTFVYTNASNTSGTTIWLRVRPLRPKTETLQDDFNTDQRPTLWPDSYGINNVAGGVATVTSQTGQQYSGLQSSTTPGQQYTLIESYVKVKFTIPNAAGNYGPMAMPLPANGTDAKVQWESGTLYFGLRSGYVFSSPGSIVLAQGSTIWVGFGEGVAGAAAFGKNDGTAGNIYWFSSTDGSSWTLRKTDTTPAWAAAVTLILDSDSTAASAISTYDDFNISSGPAPITAEPTGIASAESFGSPTASATLTASPGGIASAETFGTPTRNATLTSSPGGIPTAEAFGTAVALAVLLVSPTGIPSAESFGTPVGPVGPLTVSPTGIPSAETFGAPTELATLLAQPISVPSAEAFGTPTEQATLTASPGGIPTAEAFGTPTELATLTASPGGITSAQAFGTPVAVATLTAVPSGIGSAESFGAPAAMTGNQVIPTGIASAESVGLPSLTMTLMVVPTGIPTQESFGSPAVTAPSAAQPSGIPSAETFGTPTELSNLNAQPTGISSSEVVGHPVLGLTLTAQPSGISSAQAFGTPTEISTLTVQPSGIGSAESFGSPANAGAITASPTGIPSAQAFGTPAELATLNSSPTGIPSAQSFGSPTATRMFRFYPVGIASAETFGIPRTFVGLENLANYTLELEPADLTPRLIGDAPRIQLEEQENRIRLGALEVLELQSEPLRWRLTGIEGEPMIVEIYASAGAQQYVGGSVIDKTGKDISAATITMTLGSERHPGTTWVAPDQDESGPVSQRHVLLMIGASESTAPGTYWVWVKIADGPSERIVGRFPQQVNVK